MRHDTLGTQTLDQVSNQSTRLGKRRIKASVMVLLLSSILSSQLEAQASTSSYQEVTPRTHAIDRTQKSIALKAEQAKMAAVIQGLPGLSNRQKNALTSLYTSSQAKLNQLRGSMFNLNKKQSSMMPGHYQYQSEMENIVALKSSLAKEHKQLKSQFKRELIRLLTPKQRQQLQSAIQKKHVNAKGIDRSWM